MYFYSSVNDLGIIYNRNVSSVEDDWRKSQTRQAYF